MSPRRIEEKKESWEVIDVSAESINTDAACDGVVYVRRTSSRGVSSEWPARCPADHPHRGERRTITEGRREKPGMPTSPFIETRRRTEVVQAAMGRPLPLPDELGRRLDLEQTHTDRQLDIFGHEGREGVAACRRAIATVRAKAGERGSEDLVATKDIAEDLDDLLGAL